MPIQGHIKERSLELRHIVANPLDNIPTKEFIYRLFINYVLHLIDLRGYGGLKLFPSQEYETRLSTDTENKLHRLIKRAAEFEMTYLPRFQNRLAKLPRAPELAKQDLMETLNDIWCDGEVNWERFLAHLTFTGAYCLKTLEIGLIYEIRFLVELSANKLDERIGKWVTNNGGWLTFFDHSMNLNMDYYYSRNTK
nr:EGFP:Bcl2 fusion protein [Hymenolepis microstoma]